MGKFAKRRAPRRLRRKGMKKRGMRKLKRNTNFIGGPNTCKITETYDLGDLVLNAPYLVGKAGITPGFRAADVAPNFGLYRIAKLEWSLRPYFDTYTAATYQGGAIGNQPVAVPYFYWKINRYGEAPAAFTGTFLREQGAVPIRIDEKIIRWSYRPNVLLADTGAAAAAQQGGSGQVKMTPWLSTDQTPGNNVFGLSSTQHYGHLMIAEGPAAGNAMPNIGRLEVKVVYEFKNPRGQIAAGSSYTVEPVSSVALKA